MARGLRIDLRKLGERMPAGVQRAGRVLGKAAEKPLVVADAISYPEDLLDPLRDRLHPVVRGRLRACTLETRAHLLGIADLPAIEYQHGEALPVTLFRVRVERPDGVAETCVRQHLPRELRRLAPGSSLRALAHQEDPRIAVLDWKRSGEVLGVATTTTSDLDQYAWPDADAWPAPGAIEVHDRGRYRRRLEERRERWRACTAQVTGASSRGARQDGREQWKLDLDLDAGRHLTVKERVPVLALAKLVGYGPRKAKLGGIVTTVETVVNEGAPLAVLAGQADDEVCVDWQATMNQPSWRETA